MQSKSLMLSTKCSVYQASPLEQTNIFVMSAKYELSVCAAWVAMHPHYEKCNEEELMFSIMNHFFLSLL